MITIREILNGKGNRIVSVGSRATLADAARCMSEQGVGALAVCDGEEVAGMLSERDLVLALAGHRAEAAAMSVAAAMRPAAEIGPDDEIDEAMRRMTDRRRRHLLVRDGEVPIGMVSIGDLVKAMQEEQAGTITSLHRYITAG